MQLLEARAEFDFEDDIHFSSTFEPKELFFAFKKGDGSRLTTGDGNIREALLRVHDYDSGVVLFPAAATECYQAVKRLVEMGISIDIQLVSDTMVLRWAWIKGTRQYS